jgi:hypothetical protein
MLYVLMVHHQFYILMKALKKINFYFIFLVVVYVPKKLYQQLYKAVTKEVQLFLVHPHYGQTYSTDKVIFLQIHNLIHIIITTQK